MESIITQFTEQSDNFSSEQNFSDKTNKKTQKLSLPGDLAIWFFIYAELAVFGILFIAFSITKYNNPEVFAAGYENLNITAGLINTLALITSSYFVMLACEYLKFHRFKQSAYSLGFALIAALVYIIVKMTEYQHAFSIGLDLNTNIFYTFYFFLTMFHFAHVLLGMAILAFMAKNAWCGYYKNNPHSGFESGACYWHMVDLVWVVLFPIVYVIH